MSKNQDYRLKNSRPDLSRPVVLWHGLRGLCPRCGKSKIFASYLKQVDHCPNCHEEIGNLHADDGPAWLTILVVGHIVVPFIAYFALHETVSQRLLMGILLASIVGLTLLLLPRSKGLFIAALWLIKNK